MNRQKILLLLYTYIHSEEINKYKPFPYILITYTYSWCFPKSHPSSVKVISNTVSLKSI